MKNKFAGKKRARRSSAPGSGAAASGGIGDFLADGHEELARRAAKRSRVSGGAGAGSGGGESASAGAGGAEGGAGKVKKDKKAKKDKKKKKKDKKKHKHSGSGGEDN